MHRGVGWAEASASWGGMGVVGKTLGLKPSTAALARWFECHPMHPKVPGLILGQGSLIQEATDRIFSHQPLSSLSFSPFLSLPKNQFLKSLPLSAYCGWIFSFKKYAKAIWVL